MHNQDPDKRKAICLRAEQLQDLVKRFADGSFKSQGKFLQPARKTGASAGKMDDYVKQVAQITKQRKKLDKAPEHNKTPECNATLQPELEEEAQRRAVEEAA